MNLISRVFACFFCVVSCGWVYGNELNAPMIFKREDDLTEFMRITIVDPKDCGFLVKVIAEDYLERCTNLDKPKIEDIESSIWWLITDEQFLKDSFALFDEFSDEEIESFLKLYRSEPMRRLSEKLSQCGKKIYSKALSIPNEPFLRSIIEAHWMEVCR